MVDLPGPVPLRGTAASPRTQAKPRVSGARTVASEVTGKSLPQLVELANALASGPPPVDYARIAQIRAAISTGTYRIEPEKIARALTGKGQ